MNETPMITLTGMTREEMEQFAVDAGEKPFRGRQLFGWVYAKRAESFDPMTDLSINFRTKLLESARIDCLALLDRAKSESGNTEKFLFATIDANLIESVVMYYDEQQEGRCTVCISSQAGCARGCSFCASGRKGLIRSLSAGEIVDQVLIMQRILEKEGRRIHNVVVMGIGEPFDNYDNFIKAVRLMNEPSGMAIGMRRLAVSTVGLPGKIRRFADEKLEMRFAVSLHAPDDATRSKLMPVNRRHPIRELLKACRYYQQVTGNRITIEYILIKGLNDSPQCSEKLGKLLQGLRVMVNLIPLNPVGHFPRQRPSLQRCREFAREVEAFGHKVALRNERGTGIDAACGQLRLSRMNH